MSNNLDKNTKISQLLSPTNSTTTKTSSNIDTAGFHEKIVLVNIGVALDSLNGSRYWTVQLQEGETTGAFTDVADADTSDGAGSYVLNSGSTDDQLYRFNYAGSKRYIRVVLTPTGSHSLGTPMCVTALLGKPAHAPVA